MNGVNNGIRLLGNQHMGSHGKMNEAALKWLNKAMRNNPNISPAEAAKLVQGYADKVRKGLENGTRKLK